MSAFDVFLVLCTAWLCFCCYQIGRIVGRNEITADDVEWKRRIDLGYGSRG